MLNKTQSQIMSTWTEGSIQNPIVTICCPTFNQEDYIEEAIDSMLEQETKYAFEIIIHDDCSKDNTPQILQQYETKYPNIIKVIYAVENQWSQGKRIFPIIYTHAKGAFIALCEGDDYWLDKQKIEIQVDEMKQYPNCNISFHSALKKFDDNSNEDKVFCRHAEKNTFFSTEDVIKYAGPLMPTASICLTREFIDSVINHDNSFFKEDMTGFFTQFFASLKGGARYIDRRMSVYRRNSEGSWTKSIGKDYQYNLKWKLKTIDSLKKANELSEFMYTKGLSNLQYKYIKRVIREKDFPLAKRERVFKLYKNELPLMVVLKWYLRYRFK